MLSPFPRNAGPDPDFFDGLTLDPSPERIGLQGGIEGLGCAVCLAPLEEDSVYCSEPCQERGSLREAAGRSVLEALKSSGSEDQTVLEAVHDAFINFVWKRDGVDRLTPLKDVQAELTTVAQMAGDLVATLSKLPADAQHWFGVHLVEALDSRDFDDWELASGLPRTRLERVVTVVECLKEAGKSKIGARTKDLELILVTELAQIWAEEHGEWPKRSYAAIEGKEAGAFRAFVRACLAALPERWRPDSSLDGIIRKVYDNPPPPKGSNLPDDLSD